ncbi:MAG: lysine--tRNA ligase [Phycisphaerales bacterium]|jgi:lysyl-tRNA synthetase, class II|nr:lysine--tRNA ligase [Phycisphaerales bacterium]
MLEKVQADRHAKLEKVRALGIDPYGGRYDTAEAIDSVLGRFVDDQEGQTADAAGRIVLFRNMGKLIFAHIRDQSGQMQFAISKKEVDEETWALASLLDLGDIVALAGPLKRTRTGEITIWANKLTLLCKSLNPMPEKFHGLTDTEARYRQRYLDLMANPESMATAAQRIEIIDHFRTTLKGKGFMEVETPMMQAICGGAAARPFITHHNTLDQQLFMRVSPELYLKRLLVGGMEKVFEINRNFRNEGIDTSHNPEFTMMELYQAYADYEVMMDITEELISGAAAKMVPALLASRDKALVAIEQIKTDAERILGNKRDPRSDEEKQQAYEEAIADYEKQLAEAPETPLFKAAAQCEAGELVLPFGRQLINYARPWRRATYADLLKEHAGVDMTDIAAVREMAREHKIDEAKMGDAFVINELFEETVEAHLVQPTFVKDYPADLCPLTRRKSDDPTIALRFEMYISRMEIANAYTELNDSEIQDANFRGQLDGEEGETMRVMDEDFIDALRHGMPPAGGLGVGIDRVAMLLTNSHSIRDVILFPLLRTDKA